MENSVVQAPTIAVGELIAPNTIIAVPSFAEVGVGATTQAKVIAATFSTVGAAFICIMKASTHADLVSNEIAPGFFGLALSVFNGCNIQTAERTERPYCTVETIPGYGEQWRCKDFVDNLKEPGDSILYYHNYVSMALDYICGADNPKVIEGFSDCRRMSVSISGQHWALLKHADGLVYDSYLTGPVSRGEWESLFIVAPTAHPTSPITIGTADATGVGRIEVIPVK